MRCELESAIDNRQSSIDNRRWGAVAMPGEVHAREDRDTDAPRTGKGAGSVPLPGRGAAGARGGRDEGEP